ncbi:MAG: hypothetical protein IAG10_11200 [Planctomycetaceae bacterium]|nr:hypothetical protein [Planctomycetaceae bacterium]
MTHVRFVSVTLAFAAVFAFGAHAPAQVKYTYKSDAERRQDERVKGQKKDVKKAQNHVADEVKDLTKAQQALRQAEAKEREARHSLEEARTRVEAQHKGSLGFDKALEEQTQAKQDFDDAKAPVLQALKAQPEYQAAQERVAAAKVRSKALKEDSSLSEEARQKALAEASRDMLAVSELEQSAFDAELKLKPQRDNLANIRTRVANLHAKLKDAVEADSEVKSGLRALRNAMQQTALAKAEVAKESQELAGDQAKLSKEQAQLNNAKVKDKMYVNTPRGRRPRTKKK